MKKLDYISAVDTMATYTTIRNCLAGLYNLGYPTIEWDPIMIRIAVRKFDNEALRIFEENIGDFPTVDKL